MSALTGAAGVALLAIVLYAVFGGADFGGGVWDLLATGPRRDAQRTAVSDAIGPVWESNHVWLIFAIVTLFTCFPAVFADLATGLNAPLTFALLGIVLRGAAFVFRNYAADTPRLARHWTIVFGISSLAAPLFLGDAAGAVATGRYAWTSPFALSVGLFAVTLCAQLAAVFLVREARERALRDDFRRRAVRATVAVWLAGAAPVLLARGGEPALFASLGAPPALAAIALALALGIVVMILVARGFDLAARVAVAGQAVAVLAGWFGAQAPALIPGRMTLAQAAAPDATLVAFLIAAGCGAVLLVPSLWLLFAVFKGPVRET